MTPLQAIQSATVVAAEHLRLSDQIGSLKPRQGGGLHRGPGRSVARRDRAAARHLRDEGAGKVHKQEPARSSAAR
jgi:hypothetical protein